MDEVRARMESIRTEAEYRGRQTRTEVTCILYYNRLDCFSLTASIHFRTTKQAKRSRTRTDHGDVSTEVVKLPRVMICRSALVA